MEWILVNSSWRLSVAAAASAMRNVAVWNRSALSRPRFHASGVRSVSMISPGMRAGLEDPAADRTRSEDHRLVNGFAAGESLEGQRGDVEVLAPAPDEHLGRGAARRRRARDAVAEEPRDDEEAGQGGTVAADERADAARERPGGIHDGGRPELAGGRRQAERPGPVPVDRRHFSSVGGPDAGPRRLAEKKVRQSARIDETVARPERPARDRTGRVRR